MRVRQKCYISGSFFLQCVFSTEELNQKKTILPEPHPKKEKKAPQLVIMCFPNLTWHDCQWVWRRGPPGGDPGGHPGGGHPGVDGVGPRGHLRAVLVLQDVLFWGRGKKKKDYKVSRCPMYYVRRDTFKHTSVTRSALNVQWNINYITIPHKYHSFFVHFLRLKVPSGSAYKHPHILSPPPLSPSPTCISFFMFFLAMPGDDLDLLLLLVDWLTAPRQVVDRTINNNNNKTSGWLAAWCSTTWELGCCPGCGLWLPVFLLLLRSRRCRWPGMFGQKDQKNTAMKKNRG